MKRILLLALVGLVAVAVAGAVTFAYVVTPPQPIRLTVVDGSTVGLIKGNFVNFTNTGAPLVGYFNATTYANQSGGPASVLTLRLFTGAFYEPVYGWLVVDVRATVQGDFASDLHLSGLTLICNQTGQPVFVWGRAQPGPTDTLGYPQPGPVNVSYDNALHWPTLAPTLLNETGKGPYYEFIFPAIISEEDILSPTEFLGFQATVTGSFTPAVSVGILLQFIDVA